ncbi:MAG: ferritin family protein [Deltaproteobacteria bacterium]|nr:ferritin family protein [Deltaproteobacteria bacterium]
MPEKITALKTAMQLEIDGEAYYLKAAEKSITPFAQKLFRQLATEERIHLKKIEEIYKALQKKGKLSEKLNLVRPSSAVQDIFKKATGKLKDKAPAESSDLDAVKTAMDMEEKSIALYDGLSKDARSSFTKRFFVLLSYEERGHYLALFDAYDYLTDPAAWLEKKEKIMLD